ncbi:hypothetical protein THSYN_10565 [Candidatus Thiodictyon syntrophicum]|jgi:DNA polymerase-3 subunit epsilon|uniref:Exonuclease domain-containing protein n=1 Tax=Candidatus Thiodictyon syntrophicum TaxID=1166950 RepID=A0A2K8U7E7_9GAMM|nr:hypothetical protein THSYN_10565 [Candidatus Thiodictyon syntrophicum]
MVQNMTTLLTQSLVIIDIETTGANPIRNDVLAVGLVPLNDATRSFVVYVRPPAPQWNPFAQANFQKFAETWESQAVSPVAACAAIEGYLAQEFHGEVVTPIGHNIGFDVAFLRKLAFLGGRDELEAVSRRALDTHTMLYLLFLQGRIPSSALSSDGAFEHFGIAVASHARHTALGDALATRELVIKLLDMLGAPFLPLAPSSRVEVRAHSLTRD